MNKYIRPVIVGIFIILAVWALNVFNKSKEPEMPIKVGLIAGLSGEYSFIGENHVKGVQLARKVYLSENPEAQIELIVEDDQFDSKRGVSAYKKLVEIDKVTVLINMTSPTINAVYDQVVQTGMPVIQSGEQGQEPTDDNVFQMLPGNIELEKQLGEYVRNLKTDKVVLIYSNEPTWIRFTEAFKEGYGSEIESHKLDLQEKDFRTTAAKISQANPTTIVYLGVAEQGAILIKELLKVLKEKPQFIFDASFQAGFSDYQRILGDLSVLDGSVVMAVKQTTKEDFVKLYKTEYGEDPGFAADFMYDSLMLLMRTYDSNNKKWINNIKNVDFEGVSGRIKFDDVGVRAPQTEIKVVTKGAL